MKRATLLAMTTVFCLGLTASASAQCVFHVDNVNNDVNNGRRIPMSGTASGNAAQNREVNTPSDHPDRWSRFTFTVQGFQPGERVLDVNLNLDIVHSWVEDLNIWLRSPSGTWVQLFNRLPGGPPRFDNFDNTYFTDEASIHIEQGSAPYSGNYKPYWGEMREFRGETPNGTWELWIYDHYFGDYGKLYRRGDGRFEENEPGAPRWREPHNQPGRRSEGGNPFEGGTWLEIIVRRVQHTQIPRLIQTGKMSFRLSDSPFYIRIGTGCGVPAFSGGLGTQAPVCITLSDLNNDGIALDFQITLNQIVNTMQSDALVTFTGTPVDDDKVRWQCDQTFQPLLCAYIAGNVQHWFSVSRVYADFTMQISDTCCQQDPFQPQTSCFVCGVNLALATQLVSPPDENQNFIAFDGFLMASGNCQAGVPIPACIRTYTMNAVAYSGGQVPDGNGDCVIDDSDILIVLFNFGGAGDGDLNNDGIVDDSDLLMTLFTFGESGCPP